MQVSNCCRTLMAFLYHHSHSSKPMPLSLSSTMMSSSSNKQIIGRGGRCHLRRHLHAGTHYRQPNFALSRPKPHSSSSSSSSTSSSSSSMYHSSSSTALSSSFEAPEPPAFNGTPIYPNVKLGAPLSSSSSNIESQSLSAQRNSDPDAVYVVTGASRGIGLQMTKSLSSRVNGTIIACCRNPSDVPQLRSFVDNYNNNDSCTAKTVVVEQLDVEDQPSIDALASKIQQQYGGRVDVLLNVAGILGDGGVTTPGPERSIRNLDRDWAEKTMAVNYFGPLFVAQALSPMMKTNVRGRKKDDSDKRRPISVIANLSARVGSISDNGLGGWISYRSSKAALNQATRTMSLELKRQGTWTVSLHPGTTDTDLSKPFQRNVREGRLFPVEFTAERLLDVVDGMEEVHSGGFYDWSGTALPF